MARVWCIWSGKSEPAPGNLEFGVRTSTWGLTQLPGTGTPQPGDFVLFGSNAPGGPRQRPELWQQLSATLLLGEVTSALYEGTAPHWPDEVRDGDVKYPHRFAFVALGQANEVVLDPAVGPLDAETTEMLRLSGPGNEDVPS